MSEPPIQKDIEVLHAKLASLAKRYIEVKKSILRAEQIDQESRANINVIKELRDVLDHLMRVAHHCLVEPNSEPGYMEKNLESVDNHLLRAEFDTLDGTECSLLDHIREQVKGYNHRTLLVAMPNYGKYKIEIDAIRDQVAIFRAAKDVGTGSMRTVLEDYRNSLIRLEKIHKEIAANGINFAALAREEQEQAEAARLEKERYQQEMERREQEMAAAAKQEKARYEQEMERKSIQRAVGWGLFSLIGGILGSLWITTLFTTQ